MHEKLMLEETYLDSCNIKRHAEIVDEHGFDTFKEVTVYSNARCAVSFTRGSTQDLAETQAIEYMATLFIGTEYEVLPGDLIEALVQGKEYIFRAGEGPKYPYHQEIPLLRKGIA